MTDIIRHIKDQIEDVTKKALAVDVDQNGGLVILENGETKTLFTGEITIRI